MTPKNSSGSQKARPSDSCAQAERPQSHQERQQHQKYPEQAVKNSGWRSQLRNRSQAVGNQHEIGALRYKVHPAEIDRRPDRIVEELTQTSVYRVVAEQRQRREKSTKGQPPQALQQLISSKRSSPGHQHTKRRRPEGEQQKHRRAGRPPQVEQQRDRQEAGGHTCPGPSPGMARFGHTLAEQVEQRSNADNCTGELPGQKNEAEQSADEHKAPKPGARNVRQRCHQHQHKKYAIPAGRSVEKLNQRERRKAETTKGRRKHTRTEQKHVGEQRLKDCGSNQQQAHGKQGFAEQAHGGRVKKVYVARVNIVHVAVENRAVEQALRDIGRRAVIREIGELSRKRRHDHNCDGRHNQPCADDRQACSFERVPGQGSHSKRVGR